jgi:hypothetical protein
MSHENDPLSASVHLRADVSNTQSGTIPVHCPGPVWDESTPVTGLGSGLGLALGLGLSEGSGEAVGSGDALGDGVGSSGVGDGESLEAGDIEGDGDELASGAGDELGLGSELSAIANPPAPARTINIAPSAILDINLR